MTSPRSHALEFWFQTTALSRPDGREVNHRSAPAVNRTFGAKCGFFATGAEGVALGRTCQPSGESGRFSPIPCGEVRDKRNQPLDTRESPHRKRPKPLHLHRHGEKPEVHSRHGGQVRHVLHDRNFLFQKNAVNRPPQVLDVVDVVRIDAHQRSSSSLPETAQHPRSGTGAPRNTEPCSSAGTIPSRPARLCPPDRVRAESTRHRSPAGAGPSP